MWSKSRANEPAAPAHAPRRGGGILSILSSDLRVEGDISAEGDVHVLGRMTGNLKAKKLTLGEGGSLSGTVEVEAAVISGTLSGRLAAQSVVLGRTAQVTADIIYVAMEMETGAIFEGYSRRVEKIEVPAAETVQLPPPRKPAAVVVAALAAEHPQDALPQPLVAERTG